MSRNQKIYFVLLAIVIACIALYFTASRIESVAEAKQKLSYDSKSAAVEYLKKAAADGSVEAALVLGYYFSHESRDGYGVLPQSETENDYEAFEYFSIAAKKGDLDAQLQLANAFEYGVGVIENDGYADTLVQRAYEKGSGKAAFYLAVEKMVESGGCYEDRLIIDANYGSRTGPECVEKGRRLFLESVDLLKRAEATGTDMIKFAASDALAEAYLKDWPNKDAKNGRYWSAKSGTAQMALREATNLKGYK